MIKAVKTGKGYTLTEVVVYLGLTVLLLVFVIVNTLSIKNASSRIRAMRHLDTAAAVALDRILREGTNSDKIEEASSLFGEDDGVLVLARGATTSTFFLEDKRVKLKQQGKETNELYLSPADLEVDKFFFRNLSDTHSQSFRIKLVISGEVGRETIERNYYGTAVLRGSY